MKNQIKAQTTQYRRKISRQHASNIDKVFKISNFYDSKKINILRLREKIQEGKKNLRQFKSINEQSLTGLRQGNLLNRRKTYYPKQKISPMLKKHQKQKTRPITQTPDNKIKTEFFTRERNKTSVDNYHQIIENTELKEIRIYPIGKRQTFLEPDDRSVNLHNKVFTQTNSQQSMGQLSKKLIINDPSEVEEFQMKIKLLWELYEMLITIMQSVNSGTPTERQVVQYIKAMKSDKYSFIQELCEKLNHRINRTIRLSRLFESISIFQLCLELISKKKVRSSELVNLLGFSSSSVAFIIKILLLTHQISHILSEEVQQIILALSNYQISTYKKQITNLKQVIREIQHNNQIHLMLRSKTFKKTQNKYTQQFFNRLISHVEKHENNFSQYVIEVFEFLAFYLHTQNYPHKLPYLSMPPTPFLTLNHSKTIIIEPWSVLAYKKSQKILIRANTRTFIESLMHQCNIIFWTDMMPRQADMLIQLLPQGPNIHWLYRYHCYHMPSVAIKRIQCAGCMEENSIIVDHKNENFQLNPKIGITMKWHGEKKDVKLLILLAILNKVLARANQKETKIKDELEKVRGDLNKINQRKNRAFRRNHTVQGL